MKGIERQQEILLAAGSILTEEGVDQLTIKNLASRVGIVESALYRHFAAKDDILAALLQELFDQLEKMFSDIKSNHAAPPVENVRQTLTCHLGFLADHPHFLVAIFSEGLQSYSDQIRSRIFKIMDLMRSTLTQFMEQAQQAGQVRTDLSAESAVRAMMGAMRLLFLEWRMDGFSFDIQAKGERQIAELMLLITKIQ